MYVSRCDRMPSKSSRSLFVVLRIRTAECVRFVRCIKQGLCLLSKVDLAISRSSFRFLFADTWHSSQGRSESMMCRRKRFGEKHETKLFFRMGGERDVSVNGQTICIIF